MSAKDITSGFAVFQMCRSGSKRTGNAPQIALQLRFNLTLSGPCACE
jgi:hypothetical protein